MPGPIKTVGTPEKHVLKMTSQPRALVAGSTLSPFGTALRTESNMGAKVLTEWWTEHDGMLWVTGVLHDPADEASVTTTEAILASWSWT